MNIVVPTYKRWKNLKGKDYFSDAKYVLPESQRDEYLKVLNIKRMIVIPDKDDGNIAKKRNWILKNIERPLLMLDDDVACIKMAEGMRYNRRVNENVKLTSRQAYDFINVGFNLAYQFGCKLWGINLKTDGMAYRQYQPFSLTNIVLGPFVGHFNHDLLYDERLPFKEDYDFGLQIMQKYKKILRLNKYSYDRGHGVSDGGVVSMRTLEKEIENCRLIEKKWGKKIINYPESPNRKSDVLNGNINIPIKGV